MTATLTIKPHLAQMQAPDTLRKLVGWVIWRYEHHDGEKKPRKVPYYADGGRRTGAHGRPEDKARMTTFDAAKAAAARRGFDGVGLCLLPEFGVVAGDWDKCMVDGGVHPDVEAVVAGTYAEYSPSGEGVRAFFLGNLGNRKDFGGDYGFEVFSTKGFVTFTGNRLDICDLLGNENIVAPASDELRLLCDQRFGVRIREEFNDDPLMSYEPQLGLTIQQLEDALDVMPDDLPYEASRGPSWLSVGMAIHHETDGSEEGFQLWDEWSVKSPKYSSQEYGRARWESFGKGGHRPTTARSLIKWANEMGAHIDVDLATAADFDAIAEDAPEGNENAPEKLRFQTIPAAEFVQGKPPGWIVKGLVPAADLIVLFGESGAGKSFVMLDICLSVARGTPWRGMRTRQGRVVYIAAEGGGGFRKRLTAYAIHHDLNLADVPIDIIHAAPNFLQKADALDVAKAIVAGGPASLVIVDTFAQVTPGANENASEGMGLAIAHCHGIRRATGATVVLVHHAGKDAAKGARGWSGLRAAADAEISVSKSAAGGRCIQVSKQKDGDDSGVWGFDLEVVPIGTDEDGDVVDSCVVVEAEIPVAVSVAGRPRRTYGKWEQAIMSVVSEFAIAQNSGIEIDAVIDEVIRRSPPPESGKRDARKQHARRAMNALCSGDVPMYLVEDDCISILG